MSQRYPGGFITKTPTAPTSSAAPGIWTVDQAMQNQKAGNWPSPPSPYIEDWFSTYLYTGTGASLPIVNGINLAANGGLTWTKARNSTAFHKWYDSARGIANAIESNTTDANQNEPTGITSFNSNGYTYGTDGNTNSSGTTYVSWTFAKRQKFFDVVTYTGDGVAGRQIAHNLGSAPGCIIVKCTSVVRDWAVWQRTLSDGTYLKLNTTDSVITNTSFQVFGDSSGQTSSVFTVGKTTSGVNGLTNANGDTYVAYLFAHDAGGFGLTGSDNVISCGSLTSTSGVVTVNLGYEPQWLMMKNTTSVDSWYMYDTMRDMSQTNDVYLQANNSNAEGSFGASYVKPTATGFTWNSTAFGGSGENYIYIAIRRGPMKVPTVGTTVFEDFTYSAGTAQTQNAGFNGDLLFIKQRGAGGDRSILIDRLRGYELLNAASTSAALTPSSFGLSNSSFPSYVGSNLSNYTSIPTGDAGWNGGGGNTYVDYAIARAPGYFDVVCYTGTGSATTFAHNLGVAPELMIVKCRSNASTEWDVYAAPLGATKYLYLQSTNAQATGTNRWNDTAPTSSVFTVATDSSVNGSGRTYVNYLFATCAGVSKVGSYTGTAALLTVNCGFTAGARFVLIKRTDSTGDWYVYDSARGISSGNDPYLFMNTTDTEFTGTNYVDTDTTGFKVTAAAPAGLNASGGTYIFLAIA